MDQGAALPKSRAALATTCQGSFPYRALGSPFARTVLSKLYMAAPQAPADGFADVAVAEDTQSGASRSQIDTGQAAMQQSTCSHFLSPQVTALASPRKVHSPRASALPFMRRILGFCI